MAAPRRDDWGGGEWRGPFEVIYFHSTPIGAMLNAGYVAEDRYPAVPPPMCVGRYVDCTSREAQWVSRGNDLLLSAKCHRYVLAVENHVIGLYPRILFFLLWNKLMFSRSFFSANRFPCRLHLPGDSNTAWPYGQTPYGQKCFN